MSGNGKRSLVPELRFSEFRKAKEWAYQPLSHLAKRSINKNGAGEHNRVLTNSAEHGIVDQRDYFDREIANLENLRGYYIVDKGDYVYNPRVSTVAPVGPISRNNIGAGVMSPLYTVFRFKAGETDFYAQYFKSTHWHRYLRQTSSTGARHDRMSISNAGFMGLPLPVPSRLEQKMIADCLSSLDQLIAAEADKLNALRMQREGMMQELFPAEGEAIPRKRFPEFQRAGHWGHEKLETLARRGSGHTPSKAHPHYYNGGIMWISLADSKRLDRGLISETEFEISEDGISNSSAVLHPAGTVVLSRDAGVGKSAVMAHPMAVSQHFIAWTCNSKKLLNWFLYYSLQRSKPLFERAATGSTIKTIGLAFFLEMRIWLPSPLEQRKIADCLLSLDQLISAQISRVALLKLHKKGLLQKMFAVSEEETT